jgi:RNA-directed DNA polymerase
LLFEKHPWYRPRHYLHFDPPVGLKKAQELVTTPTLVATHSFYPLISYQITTEKLKRDTETKRLVKHPKPRDIAYAAHLDSCIYSYYAYQLGMRYEAELEARVIDDHVLAFRSLGKSNIDFAAQAFGSIKVRGNCSAVALDIRGFFDNLNHEQLKSAWALILNDVKLPSDHFAVFKSLTKFSTVEKEGLFKTLGVSPHNPKFGRQRICSAKDFREKVRDGGLIHQHTESKGIPQGTPISALLSNIYMIEFDQLMCQRMSQVGGDYFRYCDDMLFIVPTEKRDEIAGEVKVEIQKLKIDINTDKTERRTFTMESGIQRADKPLQYLGFTFDGQRVLLRSAALARYSERMKRGVRMAKATMRKRNTARLSRGEEPKPLFKKKLYQRYSHLGKKNFLRYGYRASEVLDTSAIKKQLKPLWLRLQNEIEK